MQPSGLDPAGTTLLGLGLLAFFALLLVGGLVLVGGLGIVGYRTFQARSATSREQGCLATAALGGLVAFLGLLGTLALLVFLFLSAVTGTAGVVRTLSEERPAAPPREPEPVPAPTPPSEPVRPRIVAEVRGPLDAELVQRLTDVATRRRQLDLRVRSRTSEDDDTWVYEFVLPPVEIDPEAIQSEMLRELEERGLVPVSLRTRRP